MTRWTTPHRGETDGDSRTLEDLYRRYWTWLVGKIGKRFDQNIAEDVAQEAYMRIAAIDGAGLKHPRAYLLRVAVNVGAEKTRRAASRGAVAALAVAHDAAELDVGIDSDQDETFLLKQVILGLPPLYRDVFLLSRFEGLTHDQIAAHLGVAVVTVERRMAKALALCAGQLRRPA